MHAVIQIANSVLATTNGKGCTEYSISLLHDGDGAHMETDPSVIMFRKGFHPGPVIKAYGESLGSCYSQNEAVSILFYFQPISTLSSLWLPKKSLS